MAGEYLPRSDDAFDTWLANFETYATAHAADLGLTENEAAEITTQKGVWDTRYAGHLEARGAALAACETKDSVRKQTESFIRALVRRFQASAAVDDAERQALGITVRDGVATDVPVPTTKPVLQVGLAAAQQHTISFADEGTPTSKKKPAGVRAAEIWCKKGGAAPAADADWTFLAIDSATPYLLEFDQTEVGTTVWYRARWLNTRQEHGPWSAALSAKVPG